MAATTQRIGFVGVGRMGANMARHLNDEGYSVSAVYDAQRDIADSLAGELDCQAPDTLAAVTAASDVVITVVTDDTSMRDVFSERRRQPASPTPPAPGLHQLRHDHAAGPR